LPISTGWQLADASVSLLATIGANQVPPKLKSSVKKTTTLSFAIFDLTKLKDFAITYFSSILL
jgi:hypothetical protein